MDAVPKEWELERRAFYEMGLQVHQDQFRRIINAGQPVDTQPPADNQRCGTQGILSPCISGKEALVRRQKPARAAGHAELPPMGMTGHNQVKPAVPVIFGELRPV